MLSLWIAVAAVLALSVTASAHAILYKRDPRASVAWAAVILFAPFFGAVFYFLFGINRVQRRAVSLRRRRKPFERGASPEICTEEELAAALGPEGAHLVPLARVGAAVTGRPLLEGNLVTPLANGEEAYPEMIRAIEGAERSVSLMSYIFVYDRAGEDFIGALGRAARRGVEVRVLVDDVGGGATLEDTERLLREAGAETARFLPLLVPWRTRYMNLRNHRKILVADGRSGFTGGMNIRETHFLQRKGPGVEQDLHFRLEGPVVEHLQDAFVDDWAFATGEILAGERWYPPLAAAGKTNARGVPFDPGLDHDSLRCVIVGALSCARRNVSIVTPYFIPDAAIIAALNVAALRGVKVDIFLPRQGDHVLVQWASTALLWQVLKGGCRVFATPPPFDHAKLMVVDGAWTCFGSANVDPRSLRLNFEFNVEAYDAALAAALERHIEARRAGAKEVTLADVDARGLPVRLRDGLARLLAPYL